MAQEPAKLAPAFVRDLQEEVLGWYAEHGRKLPWRETRDPYHIHVSELMLQQTQAERVIPKYETFLAEFPTVASLAASELGEVLRLWSGLGYNRRAKYLREAAQYVVRHNGYACFDTALKLQQLPGVGPYTARAISVFAWNRDEVLLETNTRRIYQLLWTGDEVREGRLTELAEQLLPKNNSANWHHALMDLGSLAKKFRSASEQQQFLISLFPLLSELSLPAFRLDRVERPRQSRFEGSRRQIRGGVLRILSGGSATANDLREQFTDPRLPAVLDELVTEGFIKKSGQNFSL